MSRLSFISALTLPLLIISTTAAYAESYSATTAKNYAVTYYNTAYGTGSTQNPFPNVSDVGGNCTNFGNQVISSGLLSKTTPKTLNDALVKDKKFPSSVRTEWFFACNTISNSCQSSTWRGAQAMFSFSRDLANAKALRMGFITKTAFSNGQLIPLDHTKVKVGDIIFADLDVLSSSSTKAVDHTMTVTEIKPLGSNPTLVQKYNSIRMTYQSSNLTDRGLGDIWSQYTCQSWYCFPKKEPAFYVYRPSEYRR